MGLILGLVKRLIKLGLLFGVFAAVIVLIPNLPPYTKFSSIEIEPTQPRVGPLSPNGALNNAEKLYKGKVDGPEAFQLYNGEIYTSLGTGEIVKISPGGHVTFVTKIGQPCSSVTQPHKCGRPLGFEIDEKTNQLYVADAFYGIWKVDLKTDKKQLLVSPRVEIEGRTPKLFNSLALAKNGDIYWTDSSSDFHLNDGAYGTLADPSGRLFHYIAARNQSKVLLDNLWFPNGVVISRDNQFLVVSESIGLRLLKYYIDGPKKGQSEVFVSGLPGVPDNLRALPDGSGILIGLITEFNENHPLLIKTMGNAPIARKFLARLSRLIEIPFEFLNKQFPHVVFEEIVHHIGHFKSISFSLSGRSGLVVVDWNGKIVASYYNTDGSVEGISDGIVYNGKLYTGNPNNQNYIAVVPAPDLLKKAFTVTKSTPQPKTPESVTKEIPKPKVEPKLQAKPTEAPKAKPVTQEPLKQKQAETLKVTTPKPVEPKPTVQPTQAPKPADKPTTPKPETKSTAPPKQAEPLKTTSPPKQEAKTTSPPKQEKKTTPPPKEEPKKTPSPKPTTPLPKTEPKVKPVTAKPTQTQEAKKADDSKQKPVEIPIKEEIPVDTVKPNKEKLKVIKKGGPTEIPNPNL